MKSLFEFNNVCRLCLKVDVKVFKLDDTKYGAFIENIIKIREINYVPSKDNYVCYMCNTLLTKTLHFIQTIWNAQKIIQHLLLNDDMITKAMLIHIDRQENKLDPINLSLIVINHENEYLSDLQSITQENKKRLLTKSNNVYGENKADNVISISDEDDNISVKLESEEEVMYESYEENVCNETSDPLDFNIEESKSQNRSNVDKLIAKKGLPTKNKIYKSDIRTSSVSEKQNCFRINEKFQDSQITSKTEKTFANDVLQIQNKIRRRYTGKYIYESNSQSSSESEKSDPKLVYDRDYKPDSTSHSEDSDFDSYDDTGKRIARPSHGRFYPRQCDHCDSKMLTAQQHHRHYIFDHPNIKYPYSINNKIACSICGQLVSAQKVRYHEANHKPLKLKCPFCPKVFTSKKNLRNHKNRVHPEKTYTCDYCSKVYKTRLDIIRHLRIHTGTKPFKCHICDAAFAHSGNRTIHIRSAHQNWKYVPKKRKKNTKNH